MSSARASAPTRAACAARSSSLDELPAAGAVLAAVPRVRAALRLAVADRRGHDPGAALADVLVDAVALAGDEPLLGVPELVAGPRRCRRRARAIVAGGAARAGRPSRTASTANGSIVAPAGPGPGDRLAGHQRRLVPADQRAGRGDPGRAARRRRGRRRSPRSGTAKKPQPDPTRARTPRPELASCDQRLDLAVARGHRLVAAVHHPGVGIAGAGVECCLDGRFGGVELTHEPRP